MVQPAYLKVMQIKDEFLATVRRYTSDEGISASLWNEIESNYTQPARHYHNLNHLNALLRELLPVRSTFGNWDTIVFAIAYHDAVYNPLKSNNEEKSADLAVKHLSSIGFPPEQSIHCHKLILATRMHEFADPETNLFTDADLSILGSAPETYHEYTRQIRREYSIYPDFMYNPGRKKVLEHFLKMPHIFKTAEFSSRYEDNARRNLRTERQTLGG